MSMIDSNPDALPPLFWLIRCRGEEIEIVSGPLADEAQLDDAMIATLVQDGVNCEDLYFAIARDSALDFETITFDQDELEWFEYEAIESGAVADGEILP